MEKRDLIHIDFDVLVDNKLRIVELIEAIRNELSNIDEIKMISSINSEFKTTLTVNEDNYECNT